MSLTGVSLLANIATLKLYHHAVDTAPPRWHRFVMFRVLARFVLVSTSSLPAGSLASVAPQAFSTKARENQLNTHKSGDPRQLKVTQECLEDVDVVPTSKTVLLSSAMSAVDLPADVKQLVTQLLRERRSQSTEADNRSQWQLMATIMDRTMFVITVTIATVDVLVYFGKCLNQ